MSRRSEPALANKSAVSNSYVEATNLHDFGAANAKRIYRVTIQATAAANQRLFVIGSETALAAPGTSLADRTLARAAYAYDESLQAPEKHVLTFNHPVRYLYMLSETGACDVDIEGDEGI